MLGYPQDRVTGHGFRATARTILDEVMGERVDLIEHQLEHAVKDANGQAYNRTSHLPARKEMFTAGPTSSTSCGTRQNLKSVN